MIYLSTLIISMFITMALIPILRGVAVRVNVMDIPNDRKIHLSPMPKIGGMAMALGTILPVALWADGDRFINSILLGAWIVVIFGAVDDFKNMDYRFKFAGQVAASLVVIFYGDLKISHLGDLLPGNVGLPNVLAVPLTVLAIVGVTNAINLSDGLDGLAGGSSLLIFLCIGYLASNGSYLPDNHIIAVFSASMIGGILGFLRFNTYPASVFMGDAGSQLLGFLAITLSLGLTQANTPLSVLLPLVLLGFPVLDTLTVMAERISKGNSPFVADKNHFHHKLIRIGLFHTEAVVTIYMLQAFLVGMAFVFRFQSEWFLLIFYLGFSAVIVSGFYAADRSGWKLRRFDVIDKVIKGKLKILKEKNLLIKVSFHFVEYAVPCLAIFCCLLPRTMPPYLTWISVCLISVICVFWLWKKTWVGGVLRLSFYLVIPMVIWFARDHMVS
jgi:UDP-GlcNAc:undecaprenyl-phosphate GlcNAc-1-phosphate transferase